MEVTRAIRRGRGTPTLELEVECRDLHAELRGRPRFGVNRPLMIGQSPGPSTHPDLPLFPRPLSSAGGKLWGMTGLTLEQYMRAFDRVNLLYTHQGQFPTTPEDRFPAGKARAAAEAMRPFLHQREVLIVGRDVAVAFGHEEEPWLKWRQCGPWGYRYALLPHPSGRNHWYNEPGNRSAACKFLKAWVKSSVLPFLPRGDMMTTVD